MVPALATQVETLQAVRNQVAAPEPAATRRLAVAPDRQLVVLPVVAPRVEGARFPEDRLPVAARQPSNIWFSNR